MAVNSTAHFWTVKACLPAMMEADHGHIVTIASSAGLCGTPGLADYCASKVCSHRTICGHSLPASTRVSPLCLFQASPTAPASGTPLPTSTRRPPSSLTSRFAWRCASRASTASRRPASVHSSSRRECSREPPPSEWLDALAARCPLSPHATCVAPSGRPERARTQPLTCHVPSHSGGHGSCRCSSPSGRPTRSSLPSGVTKRLGRPRQHCSSTVGALLGDVPDRTTHTPWLNSQVLVMPFAIHLAPICRAILPVSVCDATVEWCAIKLPALDGPGARDRAPFPICHDSRTPSHPLPLHPLHRVVLFRFGVLDSMNDFKGRGAGGKAPYPVGSSVKTRSSPKVA